MMPRRKYPIITFKKAEFYVYHAYAPKKKVMGYPVKIAPGHPDSFLHRIHSHWWNCSEISKGYFMGSGSTMRGTAMNTRKAWLKAVAVGKARKRLAEEKGGK